MLFVDAYLTSARRLIDEGETMGGRPGAALLTLAGSYLKTAADGLQPVNDNANAMGDGFEAAPRAQS